MSEAGHRMWRLPARIASLLSFVGPATTAFLGSLILSAIAILGSAGPNRDGMLYIDTARVVVESGLAAARANFDWPFLPLVIALVSSLTGLGLEAAAYALSAVLLAGVCATLVTLTRRQFPAAAWAACLVALALPAFNAYRGDIIREFGFWLFCLQAFLLALWWAERPGWARAMVVQLTICAASLFRLEAVALYPALLLWQAFSAPPGERLRRLAMLGSLAAVGVAIAAALVATERIALYGRVGYYLTALDPVAKLNHFHDTAQRMAAAVLNKYSADEAASILFFGMLSVIPVKFVQMTGLFLVPLAYAFARVPVRTLIARWQPLGWGFLVYLVVLVVFLTHQFFLTGRYVSFLNLLTVPLIALGLTSLLAHRPKWRAPLIALALLLALSNVVELTARKTQYRDAGQWLEAHAAPPTRVYIEDPRIAYYAGRPYVPGMGAEMARDAVASAVRGGEFDMAALDVRHEEAGLAEWLQAAGLAERARFANSAGDAVVVVAARP